MVHVLLAANAVLWLYLLLVLGLRAANAVRTYTPRRTPLLSVLTIALLSLTIDSLVFLYALHVPEARRDDVLYAIFLTMNVPIFVAAVYLLTHLEE